MPDGTSVFGIGPSFKAGGTIAPSRFVTISTVNAQEVLQATANAVCVGVSQEGQKVTPGLPGADDTIAAQAGDPLQVYTFGTIAKLTAGGAVTLGALLESDATGRGIVATGAARNVGGMALQAAAAGEKFDCWVFPPSVKP